MDGAVWKQKVGHINATADNGLRGIGIKKRLVFLIAGALLLLSACQSINRTRTELAVPEGCVIFTFDDGPNAHEDTTARLLDVLRKYHIRAMFALLGENVERNPDLVRRIHDEGHYIINHGYGGKWAYNMDGEAFKENLLRGEAAITAALGQAPEPLLYRPHGGFYKKKHERMWREAGYTLAPGSARAYDAVKDAADAEAVKNMIMDAVITQKGGVILLHDARDSHFLMEERLAKAPTGVFNRSWIPHTTEEIILLLTEKGFRLTGFDPKLPFLNQPVD
jgi:peptidoglycan/xylan/chitin deacetylase (PgdA/CDA1 family)